MKLLQRRGTSTIIPPQKNKKEWEFPTFTNDAFLYPMVIGGMVHVYAFFHWLQTDTAFYLLHKFDPRTTISFYEYDYRTIAVSGLVFIFSLMTYLGITDVLIARFSRKGIRSMISYPKRKIASGFLEVREWRSASKEPVGIMDDGSDRHPEHEHQQENP